jgi:hypothetical protein
MRLFDDSAKRDVTDFANTEIAQIHPTKVGIIRGYRRTGITFIGGDDEVVWRGVLIATVN